MTDSEANDALLSGPDIHHRPLIEIDVLLIGDIASPRFDEVLLELPLNASSLCENSSCRNAREAIERLDAHHESPQLVLVYQSYPDEYPRADVEQLIGRLPLSRFVVVFGPWCESIGRTEQVWPIGWCVPLLHSPVRLQRELASLADNQPPMPATTSRDEAFAASVKSAFGNGLGTKDQLDNGRRLTARVTGTDREFVECIRETITTLGLQLVGNLESEMPARNGVPADIDVLAVSLADKWACQAVARRRAESPTTCLIVSSDLATPNDVASLLAAGADHVIGQLQFAQEFAVIIHSAETLTEVLSESRR
jgi:hypothetical protein